MRISKLNGIITEIEENYEEDEFELEIENMPEEEFGKSDSPAVLLSKERVKYMDFQEWNELNRYHFRRLLEALIDGRVVMTPPDRGIGASIGIPSRRSMPSVVALDGRARP